MSKLYRRPSIDASYQVSVHLAEGFQRRRLKCEMLTDDRQQTTDAKWWQKLTLLWQGELKKNMKYVGHLITMQLNLQLQIVVDFKERAKEWHQISQIHCIPVLSMLISIHRACNSIMVHDLITLKFIWPPLLVLCLKITQLQDKCCFFCIKCHHVMSHWPIFSSIKVSPMILTISLSEIKGKMSNLPIKCNFGKSCTIWHLSCIFTYFLFFGFFALFNKLWWNTISSPIFSLFFSTIILKKVNAN